MSQQALAPGTDSPSHRAVIHLQQCHFPSIWAPGPLAVGVGHQGPGAGTAEPRIISGGRPLPLSQTYPLVSFVTGKKSPALALQDKRSPKQKLQALGHLPSPLSCHPCCLKPWLHGEKPVLGGLRQGTTLEPQPYPLCSGHEVWAQCAMFLSTPLPTVFLFPCFVFPTGRASFLLSWNQSVYQTMT